MRAGDESFERLRAAIEDIAAGDVPELLAEARAQARARVRSMLTEAMAQTMLECAREQLETADHGELAARPPGPEPSGAASPRANPEPTVAGSPPPPVRGDTGFGWYVYCVTHADGPAIRSGLPGIDPARDVTALQDGQLVAVVSQVPLEDFDEERLRERLADMNWLERTARRHEEVLDSIRAERTVIPMRLCSIYRDENGVRAMLAREAEALASALERLDGKAEWGVKVFLVGEPPAQEIEHDPAAAPEGADAGAAYMERRRHEHRQRQSSHRRFEEACTLIHERLSATAVEGLIAPPQRSEVSDHAGEMILNGVYLVQDSERDSFNSQLSFLQAEFEPLGLELELTGPWPAYNFVSGTIGAAW